MAQADQQEGFPLWAREVMQAVAGVPSVDLEGAYEADMAGGAIKALWAKGDWSAYQRSLRLEDNSTPDPVVYTFHSRDSERGRGAFQDTLSHLVENVGTRPAPLCENRMAATVTS